MAPCPRCGWSTPQDAAFGLCAACLLATAAAMPADEPCYQTLSVIAADADACVYLAESHAPGYVALKLLTRRDNADEVLERFEYWKPALLSLRHPHVAPIVDAGVTNHGGVYLASRYVGGSMLTAVVARQKLTPHERTELKHQLGAALDAIHATGLVHLKLDASRVKIVLAGGPHLTILGVGSALVVDGSHGPPEEDRAALARIMRVLGV